MWKFNGQRRPDFAIEPSPDQESVWDYPRPPIASASGHLIEVRSGDTALASTEKGYRLMETASPPGYYLPPDSLDWDQLVSIPGSSVCEWKGAAQYWALAKAPGVPVAWAYPRPRPGFVLLKDYVSFYPGRIACFVAHERVQPQPGQFYGGWITRNVVGPFKGDPGTGHW